jgi:hypothetical protein
MGQFNIDALYNELELAGPEHPIGVDAPVPDIA